MRLVQWSCGFYVATMLRPPADIDVTLVLAGIVFERRARRDAPVGRIRPDVPGCRHSNAIALIRGLDRSAYRFD
jgi:hypothetical protein